MKKLLLLILLINSLLGKAQISDETEKLIKPFEKFDLFNAMDETVEVSADLLEKNTSNNELYYLSINGKNTYIKGVAIKALINKKSNLIFEIFDKTLNDTSSVYYATTCLSSKTNLSDYIYQSLIFNRNYNSNEIEYNKVNMVNSILQKNPINVKLLETIYYWIPQNEKFYEPIKKIVIENKSSILLTTIAKYNEQKDIDLIKSFGDKAFEAIEAFPDNRFLPLLDENTNNFNSYQYMFALTKYCNENSKSIVEKVIKIGLEATKKDSCGNICFNTLYNQIEMNKCRIYYPLLEKLWLTNKIISYNIYANYSTEHTPVETQKFLMDGLMLAGRSEIIKKNIYDNDDPSFINENTFFTYEETIVHFLKELKKYSNEDYEKALKNNLLYIDGLSLESFVKELNDRKSLLKMKDSFIDKIKNNDNIYEALLMMDAIKLLKDKETFKKAFEALKLRRKEFKSNEGWEDSLQEFLKENNLRIE